MNFQKAVSVHHFIGYVVMSLVFLGDIGAVIIGRRSMGGDLSTQAAIYFLTVATTGGMYLAWHNIKRQQIDQHRKWMLRAMFWMGIIVTMRVIQFFTILAISHVGGYATVSSRSTMSLSIFSRVTFLILSYGLAMKLCSSWGTPQRMLKSFRHVTWAERHSLASQPISRVTFTSAVPFDYHSVWPPGRLLSFILSGSSSTYATLQLEPSSSNNIDDCYAASFDSQGKRAAPSHIVSQTTRRRACGRGQRRYNVRPLG